MIAFLQGTDILKWKNIVVANISRCKLVIKCIEILFIFLYLSLLKLVAMNQICVNREVPVSFPRCLLITLFRKEYNSLNPLQILPGLAIFFYLQCSTCTKVIFASLISFRFCRVAVLSYHLAPFRRTFSLQWKGGMGWRRSDLLNIPS